MYGLCMLYVSCQTMRCLNKQFNVKHMRLTTRLFRGADSGNMLDKTSAAGVQSIGLVYEGCPLDLRYQKFFKDSSHYVSFGQHVQANGVSFRTLSLPDTQHLDATGFTVAVCDSTAPITSPLNCPEKDWKVITSSRCIWTTYDLACVNIKDGKYPFIV